MSFISQLYRYLPHQCPLCLDASDQYLCSACTRGLPLIPAPCYVCGLPLATANTTCGDCLQHLKPYEQTVCPFLYRHPVDILLREFKNRRPLIAAQALLPHLLECLYERYREQPWPELLVPIPMHWSKAFSRGFNQAQVLTQLLGRHTGIESRILLRRPLRLRNQKGLARKQRFANLRRAFVCDTQLNGRHVAIVDDVVTTCATAMAAAETLRQAGAGQIDIWALARTPSD